MRIPSSALGALAVTLASAIFGTVGIAVQAAVAAGFALPLLLALRYLGTAGAVHSIALARREHRLRRFGRPHLAAFGLGLAALAQTGCYFAAMTRVDVALVLALHFTFPAIVLAAEATLSRRLPSRRHLVSCALALAGVALVVLSSGTSGADPIGLVLALGSGVAYAAIVLAWTRVLRRLPVAAATAFQATGLAAAWVGACIVLGVSVEIPGLTGLQWIVTIVVFCSVLPMLLHGAGTARVGSVSSAVLATVEPVVGAIVAAVLLNQVPAAAAVAGSLLIVGGSLVVVVPAPGQRLAALQLRLHRVSRPLRGGLARPAALPRLAAARLGSVLLGTRFGTVRPAGARRPSARPPARGATRPVRRGRTPAVRR